jgi:hypothetical protein
MHLAFAGKAVGLLSACPLGKVEDMTAPQQLSQQAIAEFREIYQAEFGKTLSDDEVQEIALRLLRFFGILTKQLPENQAE